MSRRVLGLISGIVFGAIAAGIMIPMQFPDKRAAIAGAFINRFAVGLVIGVADLGVPGWLNGLIWGVLLSLPDAIITKAFVPIMTLGTIGGLIIGWIIGKWGA